MAEIEKSKKGPKPRTPGGMTILYEDREILVVVKPAGLLTIGTDRDKTRTAHYLLNDYVRKGDPKSRQRVYVVHRLDQDTSGLLLFARSEVAKTFLQEHWQETEKIYFALVSGRLALPAGEISSYLTENSAQRVYSTPDPSQGKLARTEYKVVTEGKGFTLVEIHLLTGRKHQIRVHFAEKGHPLLGDKKYGTPGVNWPRLALHAASLSFLHPFNGRRMTFTAPLPEEFLRLLPRP